MKLRSAKDVYCDIVCHERDSDGALAIEADRDAVRRECAEDGGKKHYELTGHRMDARIWNAIRQGGKVDDKRERLAKALWYQAGSAMAWEYAEEFIQGRYLDMVDVVLAELEKMKEEA